MSDERRRTPTSVSLSLSLFLLRYFSLFGPRPPVTDTEGGLSPPFRHRWDEGLLDMCIGEKRKLTIPPDMGYGSNPVGPIPANSVLVFETELMGIKGVKKDEL